MKCSKEQLDFLKIYVSKFASNLLQVDIFLLFSEVYIVTKCKIEGNERKAMVYFYIDSKASNYYWWEIYNYVNLKLSQYFK